MTKKVLSIVLCLALLLPLAGCGNNANSGDESTGDTSKPLEISIGYWDAETYLVDDDVTKALEEKFNVNFVPVNMTWEDYGQKEQL